MKRLLCALCALACACVLAVCALNAGAATPEVKMKTSATLEVGGTTTLTATLFNHSDVYDVSWSSLDPNVATVQGNTPNTRSATVTGVAQGTTEIYATVTYMDGEKEVSITATCVVEVVPAPVRVVNIGLEKTALTLEVGDTETLIPTITPSNATNKRVDWSWTAAATGGGEITLANGTITGKKAGDVTVTAIAADSYTKADGTEAEQATWKKASCTVTVVPKTVLELKETSLEMTVDDTKTLSDLIDEKNPDNANVEWKVTDGDAVTVTNGTLTASEAGKATVTAQITNSTSQKTVEATLNVTVYAVPTGVAIYDRDTNKRLDGNTGENDVYPLNKGDSLNLRVSVLPREAKQEGVTLSSSNQSALAVQGFKLQARNASSGVVTITATTSTTPAATATVKFKVIEAAEGIRLKPGAYILNKDATATLTATFTNAPSTGQDAVTWASSDTGVVTVTPTSAGSTTATIRGVSPGKATITATALNGSSARCTVTVVQPPTNLTLWAAGAQPATGPNGVYHIAVTTTVGAPVRLQAAATPANATTAEGGKLNVEWSSDDPDTGSITSRYTQVGSDGTASTTVRALRPGTVTITARAGDKTAKCTITINPVNVTGLTLNRTQVTVSAGSSFELEAAFTPANPTNQAIEWSVTAGDASLVRLGSGTTSQCRVTGQKPGKVTVTAKAVGSADPDHPVTATCEVTVTDVPVTGVTITPKDKKFILTPGGVVQQDLRAVLTPERAGENTVYWASSDAKVAVVNYKQANGDSRLAVVSIPKDAVPGEATITASVGDIKDTVTVAVSGVVLEPNELKLAVREDKYVTRKLYGAALTVSSTDWEWSSSNDKIARVNPTSGQITGVAVGKATITCKNGDYSASIPVTVSANSEGVITASLTGGQLSFSSIASKINSQAGGKLRYVTGLSVSPDEGTLYYGYVSEGDTGAGVSASDSFYYSGSGTQKLLGKIIFVPRAGFSGQADISYTGIDSSGDNHPGTVKVTVGAARQISYTCPQGECVYFHSDDFTNYCHGLYGYPIASVRFATPPAERCGYLYYEYAGGEVFGSNVSAGKRYYSSSTPALDSVSFVPRADYAGSFTLPYTGWDTAGNTFSGSIRITVTGRDGQAAPGDISYAAHSGKRFYFDVADFADLCRETTGGALSYVQFTDLGDASGKARLYAGRSGSSALYANTPYYHSTAGSYRLMDVNIVPYSTFTGTLTIPFRAYDTAKQSFTGRVLVDVTKDSGSADTIYKTSTGMPVSFQRAEFTQACEGQLPGELTSVRFYLPGPSTGVLYAGFNGLNDNRPLAAEEYLPAADLTSLTFVPQGGFSGSAYLNYVARDERNNTCSGTVRVAVWPAAESGYFNDMKSYGWAVSSVDFLRRYGVVTGSTQTTFLPGQAMSRGDFVLMLARAYDLPGAGSASFPDVPANSYYAQAIASARKRGIATGDPLGNFNPKRGLTRQEAAVFLYRTMQADGTAVPGSDYDLLRFPDADRVAGYAREAMASLAGLGVFQGDGQGRLNPTAPLSRAEMAVILHRAIT